MSSEGPVADDSGTATTVGAVAVSPPAPGDSLAALVEVMTTLRARCPWDRVQTHGSLRRHLLDEAYETLDALDRIAASPEDLAATDDAFDDLREELGDVLFQVVFHAHLASEAARFDLSDVIDGVRDKLVSRHPGIFGPDVDTEATADRDDPVATRGVEWERAKVAEKGRASVMDGIPSTLPALLYASKVVAKAAVVAPGLSAERHARAEPVDGEDLGHELLALVLAARHAGLDAEAALRSAARDLEMLVREAERADSSAGDDNDLA